MTTVNKNSAGDTFTFSSPAENKSSSIQTIAKKDSSEKAVSSGSVSKKDIGSSKNDIPDSMKRYFEHVKDPVQRAAMERTMNTHSVYVDKKYIYESPDYGDNCCVTATAMLAAINSDGKCKSNGTMTIGKYTRKDHKGIADYDVNKKGFHEYTDLSEEDINKIVTSEIDEGRVVMLHTEYDKNEHWVIVSSYNLDDNGNVNYTYENGKKYITGFGGIDPEEEHHSDVPQKTNNLGKNSTVSKGGQWLNGSGTVRTFNP